MVWRDGRWQDAEKVAQHDAVYSPEGIRWSSMGPGARERYYRTGRVSE
jgi:hypothetical protein